MAKLEQFMTEVHTLTEHIKKQQELYNQTQNVDVEAQSQKNWH